MPPCHWLQKDELFVFIAQQTGVISAVTVVIDGPASHSSSPTPTPTPLPPNRQQQQGNILAADDATQLQTRISFFRHGVLFILFYARREFNQC